MEIIIDMPKGKEDVKTALEKKIKKDYGNDKPKDDETFIDYGNQVQKKVDHFITELEAYIKKGR